jgi:hypothetical protein
MLLNVYFKTIDDATRPILKELRNMRYPAIKLWVNASQKSEVCFMRDYTKIEHTNTDRQLTCINWDINTCYGIPECDGIEHLVWRSLKEHTQFVCIDSATHCNQQLVLFQDAKHLSAFPCEFVKVPCFDSLSEFMDYALEKGVFSFSLNDTTRFEKYQGIGHIQGASVYKEKGKNRYWYIDMLHKTHYEVFDNTGKHLGEADMDGVLDETKRDDKKRINL